MEEVKDNRIQDETLEQINGGNDAQYAEIFNYIALHDPAAYAAIQAKDPMWRRSSAMRYLYDHGVPVVMTGNFLGEKLLCAGYDGPGETADHGNTRPAQSCAADGYDP